MTDEFRLGGCNLKEGLTFKETYDVKMALTEPRLIGPVDTIVSKQFDATLEALTAAAHA